MIIFDDSNTARFARGQRFGVIFSILSRALTDADVAHSSENIMSNPVAPLQKSQKVHQIMADLPPILRAGFSSFGGVELDRS